jgi:hypothetical protein
MTEDPSHELATAEEWNRARHRETVLRSLLTQPSLSETDIQIASKQIGVKRAYFYRRNSGRGIQGGIQGGIQDEEFRTDGSDPNATVSDSLTSRAFP